MEEEFDKLKMAVISGAANAIKFKERNPRALESEIMQYISTNVEEILEKIDDSFE
jgi:archaellum component FlaC